MRKFEQYSCTVNADRLCDWNNIGEIDDMLFYFCPDCGIRVVSIPVYSTKRREEFILNANIEFAHINAQ